jgi:hemerythrin
MPTLSASRAHELKTFIWGRHFETGIATIDEQHRRLVALINRLSESFGAEGTDPAALHGIFDELAQYAKEHFGVEERLMQTEGLAPEYIARHRAVHAEFAAQLNLLWKSRDSMNDPEETLLGFLVAWLGFHILGEDRAMATQIVAVRAGARPEAAFEQFGAHHADDSRMHALIDALQGLYHTVSLQNQDLADANMRLEERVAERTRDLGEANAALRVAYEKMEDLTRVDGLLGIANRRHFDERLDREWKRAFRERVPVALLMIDVDHFKRYNDMYGHPTGDDCLKAVSNAISGGKRATDMLARYGGEEFVLLLPDTSLAGAAKVGGDVRAAVENASIAHLASPAADHVTVSIGAASLVPGDPGGAANLIAMADRALYAAKEGGRNQVVTEPAKAGGRNQVAPEPAT